MLKSFPLIQVSVTHKKSSAWEVKKLFKIKDLFARDLAFTSAIVIGVGPITVRSSQSSGRRFRAFMPPLWRPGERRRPVWSSVFGPTSVIRENVIERTPGNKAMTIQSVVTQHTPIIPPETLSDMKFYFHQHSTVFTPASVTPSPRKRNWHTPEFKGDDI